MAVYWMTEALPISVTSLIPVALFPILGVASTGAVVSAYLRENGMLYLGSVMLATSIEGSHSEFSWFLAAEQDVSYIIDHIIRYIIYQVIKLIF